MTKEEFKEIKEYYIESTKENLLKHGTIEPVITIMGNLKDNNTPSALQIVLPEEVANSDENKQLFVDQVIPKLAVEVREKFTIQAVGWSSEAWLREIPKDEFNVEDYKKIPIKREILIITIDTAKESECYAYEIVRMSVSPNGDLVENVELVELPDVASSASNSQGRFNNLYRKFTS
jgi:hypothetical protein